MLILSMRRRSKLGLVMSELLNTLKSIAQAEPNKKAVITESLTLSYQQLLSDVAMTADLLSVYQGQVVALLADNGLEWLIVDLAAQMAGVILLPIPIYFTDRQIQHALQSTAACSLIYSDDFLPISVLSTFPSAPKAFGASTLLKIDCPRWPSVQLPQGTDKITFTSGSTGTPKGVCLSNKQQFNVANALLAMTNLNKPRHLAVLPLSTLLENIAGVYAPLLTGGEVVLMPIAKRGYLAGHQAFLQSINAIQPNTMILVPELLTLLLNATRQGWQPPSSLTFIAVGGSRVAADLILQARQAGLPVYEGYGLSEAGSVVSLNTPLADQPGTAGMLLPHISMTVEAGEIVIHGSQFLGYIGDKTSTVDKFYTGDLGALDSAGFLHIKGRKKQLLISSYGRNINPEWIESEILSHPDIQQSVVFGDAQPYCIALIYSPLSDADLQQHLNMINQQLPDYARIYRWHRLPQPLSNQQGLLTANGRPKRAVIFDHYQHIIHTLYQEETDGILCHAAS